jgi:hypothetical protein
VCKNRERKKEKERDEVWSRLEAMATQNASKSASGIKPAFALSPSFKARSIVQDDEDEDDLEYSNDRMEAGDVLTKDINRSSFNVSLLLFSSFFVSFLTVRIL